MDDRIKWIVDDLVNIFLACNVEEMLKNYGKSSKMEDPIIHFYEDFLSEYDPKLRKARGVWYTPAPVVNFITRAVDEILKTEFDLPYGLADTSKTKIKVNVQGKMVDQEVHKVQILDPATGTGTFLAEVIKLIYKKFEGQQGIWSNYVETHLLPRLNGFEILMASYAMAHLKLDLLLKETGFKATKNQRFKVYLTNSLEEYHQDTGTLFANWLSAEADEANHIKRDTPVMCIIGNPPYAVSSTNKSEWIQNLIADYKKDLNERKINLDDDYIKFIRYGQHFIDKNGSGILAYISNNSFIDGITHRQMRKHLLESFDKIYILDLHGNAKKKEICPDGSADQNVFDIMQGVSINIFVKTGKKKSNELGQIYHYDLQGKREYKYDYLTTSDLKSVDWKLLKFSNPNYFFMPNSMDENYSYNEGFKVSEIFQFNNTGIQTKRDSLTIQYTKSDIEKVLIDFLKEDKTNLKTKYLIRDDGRDWGLNWAIDDLKNNNPKIIKILYRPFDVKYTLYTGKSKGFIAYPRNSLNVHIIEKDNISVSFKRQSKFDFSYVFVHKLICESCLFESAYANNSEFPLYLYPENIGQTFNVPNKDRTPNLNLAIVTQIAEKIGLTFTNEKEETENTFAPIDILDYIYAVLHSPTYRDKYKEFLKIDFPRVPYPKDQKTFWELVKLGGEIRQIHLLDSPILNKTQIQYPIEGTHEVIKPIYENGKVFINETQYFDHVPEVAWNFYIGGYQPAQKWLKDRKGRTLNFEDIVHYQKIIIALSETDRLMKEIDKIVVE